MLRASDIKEVYLIGLNPTTLSPARKVGVNFCTATGRFDCQSLVHVQAERPIRRGVAVNERRQRPEVFRSRTRALATVERVDYPKTLSLRQKRPATLRLVAALLGLGPVGAVGGQYFINNSTIDIIFWSGRPENQSRS